MKCRDCEHRGLGYDEDTPVWGVCWKRGSCPDPDIERNCPDFSPQKPSLLEQLQSENERLRAELERMAGCVHYRPGGLCGYGGDDPANVCVLGPCPHEKARGG